jgi:Tol biopolymer transport system component
MLAAGGKTEVSVGFAGAVKDLSVAPDGVRIAFTAQPIGSKSTGLFLAAIDGGQQQNNGQLGSPATHQSIRVYASLGPNLSDPASLTWYDADDLIVLNDEADGNTLWQVPVDGQSAAKLQVAPTGVTSITADGPANVLVASVAGGNLYVSTSLEGGWYQLGNPGQNPAYPG